MVYGKINRYEILKMELNKLHTFAIDLIFEYLGMSIQTQDETALDFVNGFSAVRKRKIDAIARKLLENECTQ